MAALSLRIQIIFPQLPEMVKQKFDLFSFDISLRHLRHIYKIGWTQVSQMIIALSLWSPP